MFPSASTPSVSCFLDNRAYCEIGSISALFRSRTEKLNHGSLIDEVTSPRCVAGKQSKELESEMYRENSESMKESRPDPASYYRTFSMLDDDVPPSDYGTDGDVILATANG